MKFDNKIEAIKALRNIPRGTAEISIATGKPTLVVSGGGLGFKEAKDLVEAICEMGVQYHLSRQRNDILREFLQTELAKLPAPPSNIPNCNRCGNSLVDQFSAQPCQTCWDKEQDRLREAQLDDDIHF